ncbi:MAG TPA: twin-arginine translocase subunit TatC [Bacteroidales bacterium]|nr:twin-arginine translocase subunit TatC [Bacteroidales bacterium]
MPAVDRSNDMSFWSHLDVLRGSLLQCLAVWLLLSLTAFCFREALFEVVFAPSLNDFFLYRVLRKSGITVPQMDIEFINTELAAQFTTHIEVAACAGLVMSLPYLIACFYNFVAPALYAREKRYTKLVITAGSLLFALGALFSYFVIFPLSVRFLANYQVYSAVHNMISLSSYIGTLLTLCLLMGLLFELPMVTYALGKLGVINGDIMRRYRRHAIVVIALLAAVITPTSDIFTLTIVTIPIYALYEFSIFVIK